VEFDLTLSASRLRLQKLKPLAIQSSFRSSCWRQFLREFQPGEIHEESFTPFNAWDYSPKAQVLVSSRRMYSKKNCEGPIGDGSAARQAFISAIRVVFCCNSALGSALLPELLLRKWPPVKR
jgi:hypothetical protein